MLKFKRRQLRRQRWRDTLCSEGRVIVKGGVVEREIEKMEKRRLAESAFVVIR